MGQTYPGRLREQVLLVYTYHGMKASILMNYYLEQAPIVLCINNVLTEVIRLRQEYKALLEKEKQDFPYLKILGRGSELNHSTYPDLYFCAITFYKGAGTLGDQGNFVRSTVQTVTPQRTLEKFCDVASGTSTITAESVDSWRQVAQQLGLSLSADAVARVARRLKREQSDSEDDDVGRPHSRRRRR